MAAQLLTPVFSLRVDQLVVGADMRVYTLVVLLSFMCTWSLAAIPPELLAEDLVVSGFYGSLDLYENPNETQKEAALWDGSSGIGLVQVRLLMLF